MLRGLQSIVKQFNPIVHSKQASTLTLPVRLALTITIFLVPILILNKFAI